MENNVNCINPKIGKMIARYELGLLSQEEKRKFESHLLECDACFQELYSLSTVMETMRENPEFFLPEVAESEKSRSTFWQRLRSAFVYEEKTGARPEARRAWVPVVRIATGLAVVVVVIFVWMYLRARLAWFDNLQTAVETLVTELETGLRQAQDPVPVFINNFVIKGTEVGSQFGFHLRNKTKEELNKSRLFKIVDDNPAKAQLFLDTEYWQVKGGIRMRAKLEDPTGIIHSSSHEIKLSKKAVEGFQVLTPVSDMEFVRTLTMNYSNSDLKVSIWTDRGIESATYQENESLEFYLSANEPCYVYVLAFMSTGDTVKLVPNDYDPNNRVEANKVYKWPDDIGRGYRWTISQPLTPHVIKAFASNSELAIGDVGSVRYLSIQDQPKYVETSMVITPVQGP